MEKIYKKDYYNAVLDVLAKESDNHCYGDKGIPVPDIRTFIKNEIDLLTRKNSRKSTKPTKNQIENEKYASMILEKMADNDAYTVSEIQALVPELATLSNQKVTGVLGIMKDNGLVKREVVKGRAYFSKM